MTSDPYFITEAEDDMGPCLVLKGPWSDKFIDVIKRENISVLRLTESMGWKENEVSFLQNIEGLGLKGVEVYAWDVKDLTPLYHLPDLEYIGLQCEFTRAPDFSEFKELTHLFLFWQPKAKSIFGCSNLKWLNVVNFPFEDLQSMKDVTKLDQLMLTSKKLISLRGIEVLGSLQSLDLARCFKLGSLTGIGNCHQLQSIEFDNCKKIYDISELGILEDLRCVVLTDCGKIKSLLPLASCRKLERLLFTGDTNIEDGELTPLLNIPELKEMWFGDKRHYSHKRDQVASMLS